MLLALFWIGIIAIDAVSIKHQSPLLDDADAALADAETQLNNLKSLARKHQRSKSPVEEQSLEHENWEKEVPPIIVGSVQHNPEIVLHPARVTEAPHPPVIFNSSENGKIHLAFESDFKTGYRRVPPPPTNPAAPVEDPWYNVTTPEEEAAIEEGEMKQKLALEEEKRKQLMKDPEADQDTSRDLALISRLGKKSETLMKQLDALTNLQGAESTPQVIAEAKKLLDIYNGIKKQIADAVMKYSSYHDFDGGFAPSPQTFTFPMENPKPPHGQKDIVLSQKRSLHSMQFNPAAYKKDEAADAQTVYTQLERPQKPIIE